jgi:hypothetical protein
MSDCMEKLEITIDPETLEYQLDIHMMKLSHMEIVLEDILKKIKEGKLTAEENIHTYPTTEDDPVDPLG